MRDRTDEEASRLVGAQATKDPLEKNPSADSLKFQKEGC